MTFSKKLPENHLTTFLLENYADYNNKKPSLFRGPEGFSKWLKSISNKHMLASKHTTTQHIKKVADDDPECIQFTTEMNYD